MSGVVLSDSEWRAGVRRELPTTQREAYLNTGGAGPLPRCSVEAMAGMLETQLSWGRMSARAVDEGRERQATVRARVASVLGGGAGDVAIAQSSTHAMNAVIWGVGLAAGDHVVTTGMEHPGLAVPLARAVAAAGATLDVLDVGDGSGDIEEAVARACGPRTRLVALSHVSWMTGAVLDVAGAARAAHAVGALTLVDGAQAVGAVPVNPADLGVDAYALPAQKWLLGPEGLGALWISGETRERVKVVFSGYETGVGHGWDGSLTMHPDARRYEASTHPEILLAGWAASLKWLVTLGLDRVHAATESAAQACRAALAVTPGVQLAAPVKSRSGLVAFHVQDATADSVAMALAERQVIVRPLPKPGGLRASCAFFTDTDDIDRLTQGLAARAACYRARP